MTEGFNDVEKSEVIGFPEAQAKITIKADLLVETDAKHEVDLMLMEDGTVKWKQVK